MTEVMHLQVSNYLKYVVVSFLKVLAALYWTGPVCVLKLTWTLIKNMVLYLLYVKHHKEVNFDLLVINY